MPFVVHVVESFGAGTLSMVASMANGQIDRGWRVLVIHSIREETPKDWGSLFRPAVEFVHLEMVREIRLAVDLCSAYRLYRHLSAVNPDVVHLHSSKAGALGRLIRPFLHGARWFVSPHGLSFLQKADGRLKSTLYLAIELILARIPVTFLACSPSEAQLVRDHLTSRVKVIRNAVLVPDAPVRERVGEQVVVGTVGRMTLQRNPDQFKHIASTLSGDAIKFRWIGGGKQETEESLKDAGVEVTGWIARTEVLDRINELDIYIQTSLWEGLPVAVLEAMAAGKPVVATHVVGNVDLVEDGVTGFLVENDEQFIERIELLVRDKALCAKMGDAARAKVLSEFSLDRQAEDLAKIYGWGDVPWYKRISCEWMMVGSDLTALAFSLATTVLLLGQLRSDRIHNDVWGWWSGEGFAQAQLFLGLSIFTVFRMAWTGQYRSRLPFWEELLAIWKELFLSATIFGVAVVAAKWPISRFLWPVSWGLSAIMLPFARGVMRRILVGWGAWKRPTVLVGNGPRVREVIKALEDERGLGMRVEANLQWKTDKGDVVNLSGTGVQVHMVSPHGIMDWLETHGRPQVIIVQEQGEVIREDDWLERMLFYRGGLQVVPSMFGLPLAGRGGAPIFRHDVVLMSVSGLVDRGPRAMLKRGFDVVGSIVGLAILSPLLALLAGLIRLQGGSDALYGHERVGRNGEPFRCWKFRTMVNDSQSVLDALLERDPLAREEWVRDFKLKNDPRITPIGSFLRRTSLDELPQLWNVLKGEMSLVGPRPVIAQELERYGNRKAFYCSLRPGITGLWQVSGRNDLSYPERVALDTWYVKNWRFWYDFVILAKTIRSVLRLDGAY